MKSSPRKRLTPEQRRSKILAAATRLFAAKGFDGASMSAIAAAAGITKPVLYDHFASKDALFETLLCQIRDGLLAKGKAVGKSSAGEEQKFRAAVDAFFEFVEAQPDEAKILLIVPQGNPVTVELSRAVQQGATAAISQLVKSHLPAGGSWHYEATGEFLKEGLHALAKWWMSHPGPGRGEIVDLAVKACWSGLRRA
ncbi:MAG: TetR/AcrR family transcriptional regulator [Bradyrhizobium sp.]